MTDERSEPDRETEITQEYTGEGLPGNEISSSAENIYVYDADDEIEEDGSVTSGDIYCDYKAENVSAAPSDAEDKADKPEIAASMERSENNTHRNDPIKHTEEKETARVYNQPHNVRIDRIYTINTIISMITLCAVAAGIFTGYAYLKKLDQELAESRERISGLEDKTGENSGGSEENYIDAISLIEEEELNEPSSPLSESDIGLERGKLLLYDSYIGYSWTPVISGVKPHSYNKENFHVTDDMRMEYVVDGETSSYFGIDVSSYQGDINWDAVRSDGVEFAILRIGVRGYGAEGNIKLDDKFISNYENAHKAGIDLGVYFYSQAISVDEAIEEAEFVLEQLDGRRLEYPVVFDWEPVDSSTAETPPRTEDVMPGTLTLSAIAFCETIKDAGYDAMIYTNKKLAYIKYDLRKLTDYPVWLALYNTDLTYYYDFDMWQYGFGQVNGIEGDVDLNIAMIKD